MAAAACLGDLEQVQRLIDEGGDVNAEGVYGKTPLTAAARGGNPEVVKLLLGKGAKASPEALQAALIMSASHNHAETVKLLLEKGA